MKRSKLETYYVETFGERENVEEAAPRRTPRRAERQEPRARAGFGRRLVIRLGLTFAPMAILGVAGMMTECGARSSASAMPDFLRSTVCARHSLMGQSSALDATFRTISDRFR